MPLHDYSCPTCGKRREVFLKIEDLASTVYCHNGHPMLRRPSAPYVRGDYPPYESPVVPGKMIEGRRAHEEHLRETGCRIMEPGETDNYRRWHREEEEKFDKKIEETAEQLITALPTEKRDKLAAEMEGGLDAKIERSTPKFN